MGGGFKLDPIVKDVIDNETYVILNKEDAIKDGEKLVDIIAQVRKETHAKKVWSISCATGQGVDTLLKQIVDILKAKYESIKLCQYSEHNLIILFTPLGLTHLLAIQFSLHKLAIENI